MSTVRRTTAIDALADAWAERALAASPTSALLAGRTAQRSALTGLSPEARHALAADAASALHGLEALPVIDDVDAVTARDLASALRLLAVEADRGTHLAEVDPITSPVSTLPRALGSLPSDTVDEREHARELMRSLPRALDDWGSSVTERCHTLAPPTRHQILAVEAQAKAWGSRPDTLATVLGNAADESTLESIRRAMLRTAARLRSIVPLAQSESAVGAEQYAVALERHLGMRLDVHDAYLWGLEAVADAASAQAKVARTLGATSIAEASAQLNQDDRRRIVGRAAVEAWLHETSQSALEQLAGTHLTIPSALQRLDARVDPAKRGGAFYTPPAPDGSRPGAITWPAEAARGAFATWRERTTVFHEGVPGHHLQLGGTAVNGDLNAWRRLIAGSSGHSEGWALYAESLMLEWGFLGDPADVFGMLDAQRFRAARVVVDIGLHLGMPHPSGLGTWDAAAAREYVRESTSMPDAFVDAEVERYLAWPGQAPTYALGARAWEDAAAHALAEGPSSREFHDRALAMGSLRLDTFTAAAVSSAAPPRPRAPQAP